MPSKLSATPLPPHPKLGEYYQDEKGRREKVDAWFNESAPHYDWITEMMSFGSGAWYRQEVLKRLGVSSGQSLLDVGSGTGMLALAAQKMVGPTGRVVALDPSPGMLAEARKAGVEETIVAFGESMPLADDSFDWLTMGYALRHVTDLNAAFAEYLRVLKPGGSILLLEISRPKNRLQMLLLKAYMKGVVPTVTKIFRKSDTASELMRYYWDTIEHCVPPETIVAALQQAGFKRARRKVFFGSLSEYSATKPKQTA